MGQEKKQRSFFELTCNDILTILCAAAVPIALGIYTTITYQQEQERQQRVQDLSMNQAMEARYDKVYDNFLKNIYNLDKYGYLNESKDPWAFANAYYRAAHRQLDPTRKGDLLQFLKEKQLIGRNNCTQQCGMERVKDIIQLNELSFDNVYLSSQTGTLNRLDLKCVSFDQVSMKNTTFFYANLHGVSFDHGRLESVNFSNASLICARFNGTEFEGVDFGESDLSDAQFINVDQSKLKLTEKQKGEAKFINELTTKLTTQKKATTTTKARTTTKMTATTTTTKTTITTTSTTTTTTKTTTSTSLSFYGVQLNYNPATLPQGWSECYKETYKTPMNSTVISKILSSCNGSQLLLGCRRVGSSQLTVAAVGNRADVLYNCSTLPTCTKQANGIGWYFSDSYSWGFAKGGDSVNRDQCDIAETDAAYRLCWHTQNVDGYRCGATTGLSNDTTWEKVIYHANQ